MQPGRGQGLQRWSPSLAVLLVTGDQLRHSTWGSHRRFLGARGPRILSLGEIKQGWRSSFLNPVSASPAGKLQPSELGEAQVTHGAAAPGQVPHPWSRKPDGAQGLWGAGGDSVTQRTAGSPAAQSQAAGSVLQGVPSRLDPTARFKTGLTLPDLTRGWEMGPGSP